MTTEQPEPEPVDLQERPPRPMPPAGTPIPAPPALAPAEACADLVAALGKLQEPTKAGKADVRSQRGAYSYTYLTLPDLLTAVRGVFAEHHLAVMQEAERIDRLIVVRTMILHKSGHVWVSPPLSLPSGGTPQEMGGALTYARRYQLATMVGLAGAEDNDAQDHRQPKPIPQGGDKTPDADDPPPLIDPETGEILESRPAKTRRTNEPRPITDKQKQAILGIAHKVFPDLHGEELKAAVAKEIRGMFPDVEAVPDGLNTAQASQVIDQLKAAAEASPAARGADDDR